MILRELVTLFSFKTDDSGIQEAQRRVNTFAGNMEAVGLRLSAMITAPIMGLATSSVMAAAHMEQVRAVFDTLTGSVENGGKFMKELTDFAKENPLFDVATIGESAKMMMSMGIPANELIGTMGKLSDVLAGSGVPMGRVAYNLGQIRLQNRATSTDLRQFAIASIPIYEYLGQALGKDEKTIMAMTSKGKIGFAEVMKAFELMTQKGGRYYGMTERMSKSISGRFNRLKEQVFLFRKELGDLIIDNMQLGRVMEFLIKLLEKGVNWFKALNPNVQRFAMIVAGIAAMIGPLTLGFGAMLKTLAFFGPVLMKAFWPLFLASAIFAIFVDDFLVWMKGGDSLLGLFLGSFEDYTDKLKATWQAFCEFLKNVFTLNIGGIMEQFKAFIGDIIIALELLTGIRQSTGKIWEQEQTKTFDLQMKLAREKLSKEIWGQLSAGQKGYLNQVAQMSGSERAYQVIRQAKFQGVSTIPSIDVVVNVAGSNASPDSIGTAVGNALSDSLMRHFRNAATDFAPATR